MNKKQWLGLGLVAVAAVGLAACGNRASRNNSNNSDAKTDLKVAIVTDTGGVDDKSFNQSAWEGLQAWGEKNGLSKDNGYTYFQSTSEADFANNFNQAATNGYKLVYGVGYKLSPAVETAADENSDINYVIIDSVIEGKENVASAVFADNEAAYLAGVAAAKSTKSNKVGFIGGARGEVITRFEKGFEAGVKSVNKDISIDVQYAEDFNNPEKGRTIAATQYGSGVDVIYQAAGGTGAGVFKEAKDLNEKKNEADKVWVIGVDRDQTDEGNYKSSDGKDSNFVLASSLKQVGKTVEDISTQAADGKFPGGKVTRFGLKDGGVDLTTANLSDDAKTAVEDAKKQILDGTVKVPEK